jgi:hypothetical protein
MRTERASAWMGVEPVDEATFIELSHEANIDQILECESGNFAILLRHQTLRVTQTRERWVRLAITCQKMVLITVLGYSRIADP